MRGKKWLTILTFLCIGLGIIGILVFNSIGEKMGYDIALATFGSALLGFVMSVAEYFVERRNAMEAFWQESQKALRVLKKVKPLNMTEPQNILLDCFAEEDKNAATQSYGESIAKSLGIEITHSAREIFIRWIKDHESALFSKFDDTDPILIEIYKNRIRSERAVFEYTFKTYLEVSELSLSELDNAYGKLDFLFGNKTIRQETYRKIYDRIRSIRNSIVAEALHFKLYTEGKCDFIVCARKILELNEILFELKESSREGYKSVCIYKKAFDEIEEALEDFRCKIYINAQREDLDHYPVAGRIISFGNEMQEGDD